MSFFKAVILLHNQLVLVDRIRTMISCYFLNTNRRRKPVSVAFSFWGLLFKVYFKYVKHLRIFYLTSLQFRFDRDVKNSPDKKKLREVNTIKPALQQTLKEPL